MVNPQCKEVGLFGGFGVLDCGEEGEVYLAVVTVLPKMGMVFERVFLGVFEDEDSIGIQKVVLIDKVGQLGQVFQRIGGIGEYDVELFIGTLDEVEDVGSYHVEIFDL